MNLKLVVASMSLLGLVSCPVFAATATTTTTTTTTKHHHVTHMHHHHHHVMRHHVVAVAPAPAPVNYKGEVPVQTAPEVCTVSPNTMVMDSMTQSLGRSMPNPCNPGWFNRLQLSGGLNVDLGKWGNRDGSYMGENYKRISLNDAYINVAANINDWTKAFASINFMNATTLPDGLGAGEYSAAYANNIQGSGNNIIQLEQAYATMGNLDQFPLFLQVGKQFEDFSRYEIHPITASLTQTLSETLATSINAGFVVPMGFHGSIYAFDDPVSKVGQNKTSTNYGASLGYDMINDQLGFDLGVGYLYNMIGANDVAYAVQNFTLDDGYNDHVGAVAAYGDVNSGPFSLSARYTTAVQRFNKFDLPKHGLGDVTFDRFGVPVIDPGANGAKPWAAGIQAGYGFEAFGCKNNNVYLGYQASREAAGLNLPKYRYLLGYGIEWWKNTNFGIEWDHDKAFNSTDGGNGNSTNLVSLRAGVLFG